MDNPASAAAPLQRAAVLLILAATVLTFIGTARNGLVWDDQQALVANEGFRGVTWDHLAWMFTTTEFGHYQPLSWLSFAVDWHVWGGVSPAGMHVTNLLLHALTGIGFFFVALRLIGRASGRPACPATIVGALGAALLFAVHPLRVESVAWASERRDVLSGAWLMLTLILYLRAAGRPHRRAAMAAALACYTLSLLSKAAGITLPFVLLLLDVYPLRRFQGLSSVRSRDSIRRVLVEKLVFLVPASSVAILALFAQSSSGALRSFEEHGLGLRMAQACSGIVFYLWKTLWPTALVPLYEQDPGATALDPVNVLSGAVVIGLTLLAFLFRRKWPALLTAWAAYLLLLAPVLGFAQSGPQVVADRYSYLSCMSWAVLFGGVIAHLWTERSLQLSVHRWVIAGALVIMTAGLGMRARAQARIWKNDVTLWATTVERTPNNGTAHANLAMALVEHGDFEQAMRHSRQALDILPGNRIAHLALARSAAELGDLTTADEHYSIALSIRPRDPPTLAALAAVKTRRGLSDEAEALYRQLIRVDKRSPTAHYLFGSFLASRRAFSEARSEFEKALKLDENQAEVRYRLAVVNLAMGNVAAAVALLEEGIQRHPKDDRMISKLAWILATCPSADIRDGPRALALANRAVDLVNGGTPAAWEAMAAALAETGDFAGATATLSMLLADENVTLPDQTRERLQAQLERYGEHKPTRDPGQDDTAAASSAAGQL